MAAVSRYRILRVTAIPRAARRTDRSVSRGARAAGSTTAISSSVTIVNAVDRSESPEQEPLAARELSHTPGLLQRALGRRLCSAFNSVWARGEPLLPQPGDVSRRGAPKETRVLPAELRRTQVADAAARIAGIQILIQHQPPGFMQSEELLVLEGAHRRHRLEPLMK